MSDVKKFDDFVRGAFSDYSPEVPAHIWDKILDEKRKRRPAGFWQHLGKGKKFLLLAGLLMTACITTWVISRTMEASHENTSGVTGGNTSQSEIKNSNTINTTADKHPADNNTTGITNPENKNESLTATNNPANNHQSDANVAGKVTIDKDPAVNDAKNSGGDSKLYSGRKTKSGRKSYRVSQTNAGIASTEESNQLKEETFDQGGNLSETEIPSGGTLMGRLLYGARNILSRELAEREMKRRELAKINYPCPTIEKDAAGNKQYVELYAGPDYGLRLFSDTANSLYLQRRKQSTKFLYAYSGGFRYTRVFGNGISVRAGINYSRINEKFTYIQSNLVQLTYIIDPGTGDTTGSYVVRGSRYRTTYNHYNTIDIPVTVGYEIGNGKLHANINAGAIINAYSWQKGEVLDTAYQPVSITTGKNTSAFQYKTNLGIAFTSALSIYYRLNDRMHLLAEPYFRYNFSPMSKDNLTLKQRYNTLGMRFGIRLDLP